MLLSETKEREYRFKLALRIGLPIFALVLILISHTLITSYDNLDPLFFVEAILLIAFSVYFILYLIYSSFDVRITEPITKVFTREYLNKYLKKEIQKSKYYTLVLINIDNLEEINNRYGIENSDRVIVGFLDWVNEFFASKGITGYPIGHLKGGAFIIGLQGKKEEHSSILELLCLKSDNFLVDNIEVKISGAINDTTFSSELKYLYENLFELQQEKKTKKSSYANIEQMNPSDLEYTVINSLKNRDFLFFRQAIEEKERVAFYELFVKLKTQDGKIIHQKSYLKVLERLGLTPSFEIAVLEELAQKCKESDEVYAINISATSLRNGIFTENMKEYLTRYPFMAYRLILIVSEIEYYTPLVQFKERIAYLRNRGIRIVIDRLGTLHTSFLYMRDLNVDAVRFDVFYSKEIENEKNRKILKSFHQLASELGLKSWIRLIEDERLKDLACEYKIDYLQGKEIYAIENMN